MIYLVKDQVHIMARIAQIYTEKYMKVSQSRKCQELLKFLQVQSQKPSSAMMKLALIRPATGKEYPELPLLQRISSLELPVSEIAAQKMLH
jgi:hypothetical protein